MGDYSYRISPPFIPLKYHLRISPKEPELVIFNGICSILYQLKNPTHEIVLNMDELTPHEVAILSVNKEKYPCKQLFFEDLKKIKFYFDHIPPIGIIVIKYTGFIRLTTTGFFKVSHEGKNYLYTQFEPNYASSFFPCVDTPSEKSFFNLEILTLPEKLVLGNTPIKKMRQIGSKMLYQFEETSKMSCYLLACYIGYGDFLEEKLSSGSSLSIPIKIYSIHPIEKLQSSLKLSVRCCQILEKFFDYPLPMKKLDFLTVINKKESGMENWGLIMCDEEILIESPDYYLNIYNKYVICHEIAHQWFGNLVTMEWWTSIWLNESFATWVSWYALSQILEDVNLWELYYYEEFIHSFHYDSLESTTPIYHQETHFDNIFNVMVYAKGCSIITMMINYMGLDTFQQAIIKYFRKYQYQNVSENDLFLFLEKESKKPIYALVKEWIYSKNYPMVTITQRGTSYLLHQSVCTFHRERHNEKNDPIWKIPLFSGEKIYLMEGKETLIPVDQIEINTLNRDFPAYYRLYYENSLWKGLTQYYQEHMSTSLDLIKWLETLHFLLISRRIASANYLDRLQDLAAMLNFQNLSHVFLKLCYDEFHLYSILPIGVAFFENIREILENKLLSFLENFPKTIPGRKITKIKLIKLLCLFGNEKIINQLVGLFRQKKFDIEHNLLKIVINVVIRSGDYSLFQNIEKYPSHQKLILMNMALCSPKNYCLQILDDILRGKYEINTVKKIFSCLKFNTEINASLWYYLEENWEKILKMEKKNILRAEYIINSLEFVADPTIISKIITFFSTIEKYPKENLNKTLEFIQVYLNCVKWIQEGFSK